MTAADIVEKLQAVGGENYSHVTISGGNPALHQGLGELVSRLSHLGIKTAVETQGTVWQDWLLTIDEVTISPKPPSSGMETNFTGLDRFVSQLSPEQASLKIVVFNREDFLYAETIHSRYPTLPFYMQVGNEDIVSTNEVELRTKLFERYEWLIQQSLASPVMNDAKVLPQLHTLIWGNKRGV